LQVTKNAKSFALTLAGGTMTIVLIVWMIFPRLSFVLFLDRVYGLGFIFFSIFIALALSKISFKGRKMQFIVPTILVTIIALDSLSLPPIYIHTEKSLNPTEFMTAPYRSWKEVEFGNWMKRYVNETSMVVADPSRVDMELLSEIGFTGKLMDLLNSSDIDTILNRNPTKSKYVLGTFWLLKEGYVTPKGPAGGRVVMKLSEDREEILFSPKFNIVCSDGDNHLFYYCKSGDEFE